MATKESRPRSKRLDDGLKSLSEFRDDFRTKFSSNDLTIGITYVNSACRSYRDREASVLNPTRVMDAGLVQLYNGFLNDDVIQKAGKELEKASNLYKNVSLICSDILDSAGILGSGGPAANESENPNIGKIHYITKHISEGFSAAHEISIMENTNGIDIEVLSHGTSLFRDEALKSIGWARVYNSDHVYNTYEKATLDGSFASLRDGEKLEYLLQAEEMNEFLRRS